MQRSRYDLPFIIAVKRKTSSYAKNVTAQQVNHKQKNHSRTNEWLVGKQRTVQKIGDDSNAPQINGLGIAL